METFVPHKRTLLVPDQAPNLYTFEWPVFNLSVDLRRRYDLWEDGWFDVEEF